ncbi:receptor-type tyrosine-protein phosphatase F-like [Argopecten irradians]|uniref:receptor-type tyrosine-protein phosphatase F-like n=1 Tax=Argopecten irradians TaxID=31199 RepID=UPI003716C202
MMAGRTLSISLILTVGTPCLALLNLALHRPTKSSDYRETYGPPDKVVDGNESNKLKDSRNRPISQCLVTAKKQRTAFWQVDLGQTVVVDHVEVIFGTGKKKKSHELRRNGYSIIVSRTPTYLPRTRDNTCYRDTDRTSKAHDNRTCSNIGRYVTIYNDRIDLNGPRYSVNAVLELCEVKVMGCPRRKFGDICGQTCSDNCKDAFCFPRNGTCMKGCSAGYIGDTCQHYCNPGSYGANCARKCGHCKRGQRSCSITDGSCPGGCMAGWQGQNCLTKCDDGWFGQNCAYKCFCKTGSCNKTDGTCAFGGCRPGYTGPSCSQECQNGVYGENCQHTCGHCKYGTTICNHIDGNCRGGCTSGYRTNKCNEVCDNGKYGDNCKETCGSCLNGTLCHHVNGTCPTGCEPGKKGDNCKRECTPGTYGSNCVHNCGSCKGGTHLCLRTNGSCPNGCSTGWQDQRCLTACNKGQYGENCSQRCGNCRNRETCNLESGKCENGCSPGWRGALCQQGKQYMYEECIYKLRLYWTASGQVGIVAVIVLVILVVIIVKRRPCPKMNTTRSFMDSSQVGYNNMTVTIDGEHLSPNRDHVQYDITGNHQHQNEAIAENLLAEITRKEQCDGFEKDFKSFLAGIRFTCDEATKDGNAERNRYKNIIPYDHSRVQLAGKQNYINANFIKNLEGKNAYVATQGPLPTTRGDFWTMVWQLQTGKIVMLANCVELAKPKVSQYWPKDGSTATFGAINITSISSKTYGVYTVRELRLENKKTKEIRVVNQFHFTKWPDQGTPEVMQCVLFLLHVQSTESKLSGPMIVHCSAGVGRTGTFIAVDALFNYGKISGQVPEPKEYVAEMRQDRADMVQKKHQYEFIYRALVELFLTNTTDPRLSNMDAKSPRLLQEYGKLDKHRPSIPRDQLSDGMARENQTKNRDPAILPGNKHRPILLSHSPNKTDYINSVILPSVQTCEGYLATQWPLPDTVDDFWAMIYDYRSTAIVILDSDDDINGPDFTPSQDSEIQRLFSEQTTSSSPYTEGPVAITEVSLSNTEEDVLQNLKIFQMRDWPHGKQTCPNGCIAQTVNAVQKWQRNVTSAGPITVVCRNGSSKCGIFCTVANAIENLNLNQQTSLIQVVRQLQYRRPSFIDSYESYIMCNRELNIHQNTKMTMEHQGISVP